MTTMQHLVSTPIRIAVTSCFQNRIQYCTSWAQLSSSHPATMFALVMPFLLIDLFLKIFPLHQEKGLNAGVFQTRASIHFILQYTLKCTGGVNIRQYHTKFISETRQKKRKPQTMNDTVTAHPKGSNGNISRRVNASWIQRSVLVRSLMRCIVFSNLRKYRSKRCRLDPICYYLHSRLSFRAWTLRVIWRFPLLVSIRKF